MSDETRKDTLTLRYSGSELDEWHQNLTLSRGSHKTPDLGMCFAEAAAWITGSDFNDTPKCMSPVIRAFAVEWNDGLPDGDQDRLLKPVLFDVIGTNTGDPAVEAELSWMAIDWLVRTFAPVWMRAAGLGGHAAQLEALPRLRPDPAPEIPEALSQARFRATAARALYDARDSRRVMEALTATAGIAATEAAVMCTPGRDADREHMAFNAWETAKFAAWVAAAGGEDLTTHVELLQASAVRLLKDMAAHAEAHVEPSAEALERAAEMVAELLDEDRE